MQNRSFQAPGPVGDRAGRASVSALAALRGSKEQASSESLAGRILTRPLGNRGTGAALGLLQHQGAVSKGSAPGGHKPELPASQPGDPAEREAEVMAEQVMRAPTGKNGYQAQRNLSTATSGSGGRHLDSGVRRFMEPKFNYDFSQVRIHTDSASMQSADDLNARAYTIGKDIYFGRGEYQPETADGQQLLAHELTHVIQQSGGARAPGIHAQAAPMIQRAVRFSSKTPLAIDHWTDGASSVTADESTVTTGDYKATAEAHVEADTAAELANWEVGFLQNDRITWERNYYTRSNADGRGKFLESKLVVPSAPLRDHEDDTIVWAASGEFADVAAAAGGATSVDIPLESTDEPESPRTNHGSDVGDATDGRDNIFERRIGDNFISFVSAHNSVTDEWRHLELIYWSGQASVDFAPTVGGAPSITKDERVLGQSRRFRWTTAADQPAIGGTLANDYVGDAANTKISRVNGWT
jgi:hypothetical protein